MNAGSRVRKWTPICGVFAIGAMVFGLSLELQGAPTASRDTGSRSLNKALQGAKGAEGGVATSALGVTEERKGGPQRAVAGQLDMLGKNVYGPFRVDYRDDEGTRLREAGLLNGPMPYPLAGGTATLGGCTFDAECLDGDPCTIDSCLFPAGTLVGQGKCTSDPVADGQPGGCGNGLLCDGAEFCQAGVCTDGIPATCCAGEDLCSELFGTCDLNSVNFGDPCDNDLQCREGRCDPCITDCRNRVCSDDESTSCTGDGDCATGTCLTNDNMCDDGIRCNGVETCDIGTGACFPSTNPCGLGADCREKVCLGGGENGKPCVTDVGCPDGACVDNGEVICFAGRCCNNLFGVTDNQFCSGSLPNLDTCINVLGPAQGHWFAGDDGKETGEPGACACGGCDPSVQIQDPWGCPQVTCGIVHTQADGPPTRPLGIGPISNSSLTVDIGTYSGPLNSMGDDYTFVGTDHRGVDVVRFYGNMLAGTRLSLEFYDDSDNFIEDLVVPPFNPGDPGIVTIVLTPALVLPPSGRIVIRVAANFSPNAAFQWFVAGRECETGVSDPLNLWMNGADISNFLPDGLPGVMAFEMAGDPAPQPIGACCDPVTGACDAKVGWICKGELKVFQEGIPCAECAGGINAGLPCRTCSGDGTTACNSQTDCDAPGPGGSCVANDNVCLGAFGLCTNDDEATCTVDGECVGNPIRCSDTGLQCATDAECPTGTCGGAGTCNFGTCKSATCGVGSCCLANGDCVEGQDLASCTILLGSFGGFGTTCDPNCCEVPGDTVADAVDPTGDTLYDTDCSDGFCYTGADQPTDAIEHVITVPTANQPPVIVTITGDNSNASSTVADPDEFWGLAEDAFDPPGWWEKFSLDGCGMVRIDLCCTQPVHEPQWSFLPVFPVGSGPSLSTSENPFNDGEADTARGGPYCDGDNLWMSYPYTPAGTYIVPVYSLPQGHLGKYQMHITVDPCPIAACCVPGSPTSTCVGNQTQIGCDALGGFWLGRPQRGGEIPICTPGICDEGSCCTAPGVCKDAKDNNNDPMTQAVCEAAPFSGTFTPNVQCRGGRCAQDTRVACETATECNVAGVGCPVGGDCCVGDLSFLAQPNPCPIIELKDDAHGQQTNDEWSGFIRISDVSSLVNPVKVSDDVMPTETAVLEWVGVQGLYRHQTRGDDCIVAGELPTDAFTVRLFDNGVGDEYIPGNLLGEWDISPENTAENEEEPTFVQTHTFFDHQLTLEATPQWPLVTLVAGEIYWIQIYNNTTDGEPNCDWWWNDASAGQGNDLLYQDQGQIFSIEDANPSDSSLWMNVAFDSPPAPIRACCTGDPGQPCVDNSFIDCEALAGSWNFGSLSCAVGTCANDASIECIGDVDCAGVGGLCTPFVCEVQRNDLCEFAPTITEGAHFFDLFGTATEGPTPEVCLDNDATTSGNDVWYFYTPTNPGTALLSTCNQEFFGDTVISVYVDSLDPSTCPCPEDANFEFLTCQDSGTPNFEFPVGCGFFGDQSEVLLSSVAPGQCYTVRVSGFGTEQTPGVLRIAFGDGAGPICGDSIRSATNGEQCDGADDSLCPGECSVFCTCPTPICGDNIAAGEELGEVCDGTDDTACAGACRPKGDPFECTCPPVCGNDTKEPGELCDGLDDALCPGQCRPAGDPLGGCKCETTCGNDIAEVGEPCDGTDDSLCPGGCLPNCTCPPAACGNGIVETAIAEECDGLATDGALCAPEDCRPAGDPAGECTCSCGAGGGSEDPALAGDGEFQRFVELILPASSAGRLTAYRVTLSSLYHPADPQPTGQLDYSASEGQVRYLNRLLDGNGLPVTDCESSAAFSTTYKCATLGCEPEYADWGALFGGASVFVSGNAVIPDSAYTVSHLAASCVGNEAACVSASAEVGVVTARHGNTNADSDGLINVADIIKTVDVVKQTSTAVFEYRVYVRSSTDPQPQLQATNVADIVIHVDAVKLKAYPFALTTCP